MSQIGGIPTTSHRVFPQEKTTPTESSNADSLAPFAHDFRTFFPGCKVPRCLCGARHQKTYRKVMKQPHKVDPHRIDTCTTYDEETDWHCPCTRQLLRKADADKQEINCQIKGIRYARYDAKNYPAYIPEGWTLFICGDREVT